MHDRYTIRFDPVKIIDHFGGIAGAIKALEKVGMTAYPKLLQKQRERGNMPADMVASLLVASIKSGKPLNLSKCLVDHN